MNQSVEIQSRDFWIKVVEMLQQNWALVDECEGGSRAWFIDDASGVFDYMDFPSIDEAARQLAGNGFSRLSLEEGWHPAPPPAPFRWSEHINGRIYSSGRFWHYVPSYIERMRARWREEAASVKLDYGSKDTDQQ